MLAATALLFTRIPGGFVPAPDKQYLIGVAQLPAGASLDRTEEVIREMSAIALTVPGIVDSVAFPGLSIAGFSAAPNEGIVFFGLEPFEQRLCAHHVVNLAGRDQETDRAAFGVDPRVDFRCEPASAVTDTTNSTLYLIPVAC